MRLPKVCSLLCCIALLPAAAVVKAQSFDYEIDSTQSTSISLTDDKTLISNIATVFTNDLVQVTVEGLTWVPVENFNSTQLQPIAINWKTFVNDKEVASDSYSLSDGDRLLPSILAAGTVPVKPGGRVTVRVVLELDGKETIAEKTLQSYGSIVSVIPLVVILVLALWTQMVEFSLFACVFVGACIVEGELNNGFKRTLDKYILEALTDEGHVYIILFTLFLSGLVSMMQKSGGMYGFTDDVAKLAKTPRWGMLSCFILACSIFYDDYANCLLAGETMRPLMDALCISREKLAFLVDSTAAPIASISPVSSWIGFEVGLIQKELDKIVERFGPEDIGVKTSGFAVFFQTIRYRYFPIYMLAFMLMLVLLERDFGGMLIAERKVRVYNRTDGGDGKGSASEIEGAHKNMPRPDTPRKSWNSFLPVLLLVGFIFYLLVASGTVEGTDQTFMDKIELSDSYTALLYGTMGAAACTALFYLLQVVQDGKLVLPDLTVLRNLVMPPEDLDEASRPRVLMSFVESTESLLFGLARVFPALIILALAWAAGSIMVAVGADRLFSSWIVGNVPPESLPTMSFVISWVMGLATGTSWGVMSILFPLIVVPTYIASDGNEAIFYATIAGVLSGSVAGDLVSPISDTAVLSSLSSDCKLLAHVTTQAPYAIVVSVVCIFCGTIPIGYGAWPNIIGFLSGWGVLGLFAYFVCKSPINAKGDFDIFTEFYIRYIRRSNAMYDQLRADTVTSFHAKMGTPEKASLKDLGSSDDEPLEGPVKDPVEQEVTMKELSDKEDEVNV